MLVIVMNYNKRRMGFEGSSLFVTRREPYVCLGSGGSVIAMYITVGIVTFRRITSEL